MRGAGGLTSCLLLHPTKISAVKSENLLFELISLSLPRLEPIGSRQPPGSLRFSDPPVPCAIRIRLKNRPNERVQWLSRVQDLKNQTDDRCHFLEDSRPAFAQTTCAFREMHAVPQRPLARDLSIDLGRPYCKLGAGSAKSEQLNPPSSSFSRRWRNIAAPWTVSVILG